MNDDINNDDLDESNVDPIDDPNAEDFSDLWAKDPNEDTSDEGGDGEGDEDDNDGDDNGDGTDTSEGDEEDGDDSENGEDDESEIELDLIEGYDEDLVAQVETLAIADQLYLPIEKVKEIFNGSPESHDALMAANKVAMDNTAINSIYNMLPEKGKDFFEYLIKTDGKGDLSGWLDLAQREIDLSSVDVENMTDDQAKIIIKADHKSKGLSDKQSKYIMEAHEDNADLIDEAKILHIASSTAATKAKADKLAIDQETIAADNAANKARQVSVVKAINETKFSTQKQEALFNLIYTNDEGSSNPRLVSTIANIIQNKPEQLVQLAMLFDGYDIEKGFNNKRLISQVESKITRKTKATIKRKTKPANRARQTSKDKLNHKAGIDDWLSDVEL